MKLNKKLSAIGCSVFLLLGCEANEEETTDSSTATTTTRAASIADADSVEDLGLSSAFALQLPTGIGGSSSASLALAEGSQSAEACMIGETVKEVVEQLNNVGNFFCHIEAEKDKIEFGVKTRITFNGEEFARIWVDDSVEGEITIYMYQDGAISEKIVVSEMSEAGVKGSIQNAGSEEYEGSLQSWASSITFDSGVTTEGLTTVSSEQSYSEEGGGSFKRSSELSLNEDDASKSTVSLASRGTWEGNSFSDRGRAAILDALGSAILESTGTHDNQSFTFTRKAFFNDEGEVVANDLSDAFASEGELYFSAEDLPEFLSEDFEPEEIPESDWDGSYDVTVTLDPESAEHQACDSDRDNDHRDCWGDGFDEGEAVE